MAGGKIADKALQGVLGIVVTVVFLLFYPWELRKTTKISVVTTI